MFKCLLWHNWIYSEPTSFTNTKTLKEFERFGVRTCKCGRKEMLLNISRYGDENWKRVA